MKYFHHLVAICLATLLSVPLLTIAGEGHDHGEGAPAVKGTALPRFAAVSDLFELVGVLNGKQITLYLDRATDNSPVNAAQIELEIGGKTYQATKQGLDEFTVVLSEVPKPGVLAVTATVIVKGSASTDTDLLAGELDIHEVARAVEASQTRLLKQYASWAAGGLAVMALFVLLLSVGRRALSSRQTRVGGAA